MIQFKNLIFELITEGKDNEIIYKKRKTTESSKILGHNRSILITFILIDIIFLRSNVLYLYVFIVLK